MRLRYGGIFSYLHIANLLLSPLLKNFENRLTFGKFIGNSVLFCETLTGYMCIRVNFCA